MRESVSAVFRHANEIFVIKRQNNLKAFPGYHAFPGGKVDKSDGANENRFFNALKREVFEELGFNLDEKIVTSCQKFALAVTPEFNPYRFENYYYLIDVREKVSFHLDASEIFDGQWISPLNLLEEYNSGNVLAVPPLVLMLEKFINKDPMDSLWDLNLSYNPDLQVPMIESVKGIRQFMPLSKTFPPAKRTNCFLIGNVLIDPSPQDASEYEKLLKTLPIDEVELIFLTHHHPDHHEFLFDIAKKYHLKVGLSEKTHDLLKEKYTESYFQNASFLFFKEGDVLTTSLGEDIIVYETPGHDEGQLSLAPKSLKWFLVGDLIQSVGTVVIGAPEGNMTKYFQSLERIIKLAPARVVPSHGIISGGVYQLELTLKHRKMRERQISELLDQGLDVDQILDKVYEGLEDRLRPYALKTLLAHIEKINC